MTKTQTPQQSAQTIPTENQQTKNVCADLFCNVLYCFVYLFVCFVALRPKSTAMVIAGRSVHLTTLFPGQA